MCFFADFDSKQRRLSDKQPALANDFRHMTKEKRQQQSGYVIAVAVGIHQQDNATVSELPDVEGGPDSGSQSVDDIADFLILQDA